MVVESLLSEYEKASRINAFVWWHELPFDTPRIVFGEMARAFYADAESGIKFRHVAELGIHLASLPPEELENMGVLPEDVHTLTGFLQQSGILGWVETWKAENPDQTTANLRLVS